MSARYASVCSSLAKQPKTWLVTGAAGFIGSHLVEKLLLLGQEVRGLDSFATGHQRNLDDVAATVGADAWKRFQFIKGDIRSRETCDAACKGVDFVLHQAALGSVPRSIEDPALSTEVNVNGFISMFLAARDAKVKRFVYASSSSVYGDSPELPKVEEKIGAPLSPYAITKYGNELYANVFSSLYGPSSAGLRYFNVFGPRQDPDGAYAAVIPKWLGLLVGKKECVIYGDGETSRDFCYVENVVEANILAATTESAKAPHRVFNIAIGEQLTLNELYTIIRDNFPEAAKATIPAAPRREEFRTGDVRHSRANISRVVEELGYEPLVVAKEGLKKTVAWYLRSRPPLFSSKRAGKLD